MLLRRRIARRNFTEFCRFTSPDEPPAHHQQVLCEKLDDVYSGVIQNLLVLMPPGSAKSTYASIKFPAYALGRWEEEGRIGNGIITGSYSQDLANTFGRRVRNFVRSTEYRALFPKTALSQDSQSKSEWETERANLYKSVGVGAGITGRRGHLGIIDDPLKGRKEADSEVVRDATNQWYLTEYMTRFVPGSPQVMILTRWHENDPAGVVLGSDWDGQSGFHTGSDGRVWYVLCIPAEAGDNDILGRKPGEMLWLDWFNEAWWAQTKRTVTLNGATMRDWNSLYQQQPTPDEGDFFRRDWFKRFHLKDAPDTRNYLSTDYAVSEGEGDFTEFGVWGLDAGDNLYALDWYYDQSTADVWIEQLLDLIKEHKPLTSYGEKGVIQKAIEPLLNKRSQERKIYCHHEWVARTANKAAMAQAFRARASMGKVYIPFTDWGDRLINQLCAFPAGKHDDAVDVCALIGLVLDELLGQSIPEKDDKQPISKWDKAFEDDEDSGFI